MTLDATTSEEGSTSLFSQIISFVFPTAHAEAPADDEGDKEEDEDDKEDGKEVAKEDEGGDDEEEEEEPEDPAPGIRADCEQSECSDAAKHFHHCTEKLEAGKGWHGEDCVEELFHMMHCVDACAAPKLWKKLV